jgi:hypothetical protein
MSRSAATRRSPGRAGLSAETRALLCCAQAALGTRDAEDVCVALRDCSSSEALCVQAVNHGMLGHLYRFTREHGAGCLSEESQGRIQELGKQSAQRGTAQAVVLLRMLEELARHGVEAVPLKGPSWSEELYGDPTVRHWEDLDLLVTHAGAVAARRALLDAGFRDWTPFNRRILGRSSLAEGEVALVSAADGDLWVDLHWEVGVSPGARTLTPEGIIARAQASTLLGRDVPCAAPLDMLLISCVHGARHQWARLELLLALAVQVCRWGEGWDGVLAAAGAAGCLRRVVVGVTHACRVLGAPLPEAVERALLGDSVGRRLLATLTPGALWGGRQVPVSEEYSRLRWVVLSEDDPAAQIGHLVVRALRPGPQDWATVDLPRALDWLYYGVRPARLACKWTAKSIASAGNRTQRTLW